MCSIGEKHISIAASKINRVEYRTNFHLSSLIKPCMQLCEFLLRKSPVNPTSRTRLSDVLHVEACAIFFLSITYPLASVSTLSETPDPHAWL